MNNDLDRYYSETNEEAYYWFTISDFTELTMKHGVDKMFQDVLDLRRQKHEAKEKIKKEKELINTELDR